MLDVVNVEEEDGMVTGPSLGMLDNLNGTLAAWSGVPPYFFLDVAGPLAPPPAATPLSAHPPPATRVGATSRMKEKALSAAPPTLAEGSATTPPTI